MRTRTLHSWFTASVERYGDEVALVVAGQDWTYLGLDRVARSVAAAVADATRRRPARVGLFASRSVAAYAGYLGVMRGGNVVVPMNVDYPAERNRQVVEVAGLDALIVDEDRDLEFMSGLELPVIELGSAAAERASRTPVAELVDDADDPQDVAYILFTSGSTGVPKGVPIRHRNLDGFIRYQLDRYRVGPGCRLSQTFGLTFDGSVFDMVVAWGSGATLVVPSRAELFDPVGFVNDHAVTHWYSVPSIVSWVRDAGSLEPGSLPTLRRSLFAGEQLTLEQALVWSDAAPHSTVENLYGPTELTVTVTAYQLPADRSAWPRTETGDRVIDVDGELVHLGRLDDQVKIMGRRLELGDVESALRRWAGVGDVVVTAGPGPTGDLQLTAVYTGTAVAVSELRGRLLPNLPIHMVPARFVHVAALPLNAHGKVDRQACRAL
jgi:non-ribosomal peptide synthetase component F